jgi:hypothetical protein
MLIVVILDEKRADGAASSGVLVRARERLFLSGGDADRGAG